MAATGPSNYAEADHLLKQASTTADREEAAHLIATAQVHATLAVAAATAAAIGGLINDGTFQSKAQSRAWADLLEPKQR